MVQQLQQLQELLQAPSVVAAGARTTAAPDLLIPAANVAAAARFRNAGASLVSLLGCMTLLHTSSGGATALPQQPTQRRP